MSHFLITGIVLGLSAGLAPGPLLTLVVSETLTRGVPAGIRVALAPLISDPPIVCVSIGMLSAMSDAHLLLGGISLVGGGIVGHMGVRLLQTTGLSIHKDARSRRSLAKGVMVNLLSPHPYLFWLTVGAPVTHRAAAVSLGAAAAFLGGFYLLLVGAKVVLALLVGRSRSFLTGRAYRYTIRGLGLALCLLALFLFKDGWTLIRGGGLP